jgi:hypothetical protein
VDEQHRIALAHGQDVHLDVVMHNREGMLGGHRAPLLAVVAVPAVAAYP